jgi:hypothetical protein
MGATFWSGLRTQYLSDVSSDFKVLDETQEIALGLFDALLKATRKNTAVRNSHNLVAWVSTARAMSQREMRGLLRRQSHSTAPSARVHPVRRAAVASLPTP